MTTTADHYDPAPERPPLTTLRWASPTRPSTELLERVSSKYALVIYAAKRARQINDYYNQLGEGISSTSVRWWAGPAGEAAVDRAARDSRRPSRTHRRRVIAAGARASHELQADHRRVAGGIAAYKACSVVRHLGEAGHQVRVVPTESALRFVGAATFEALSGHRFAPGVRTMPEVPHVRLGQEADLVVVAPATADLLARAASGRADDLLTATLLTARCPVLFAPAMHTEMWQHPATVANVATLRSRGAVVLEPAFGRLTEADTGAGRLPSPRDQHLRGVAAGARGRPAARFERGQGSGDRRGHPRGAGPGAVHRQPEFGQAGLRAGAGGGSARGGGHPDSRKHRRVGRPGRGVRRAGDLSGADARGGVKHAPDAHVLVMAAAVADSVPPTSPPARSKKSADPADRPTVELVRTEDVLAGAVRLRADGQLPDMRAIVGFAAETGDANGDVLHHARAKLRRRAATCWWSTPWGRRAFEVDSNAGWLLGGDGSEVALGAWFEDSDGKAVLWTRSRRSCAAAGNERRTSRSRGSAGDHVRVPDTR